MVWGKFVENRDMVGDVGNLVRGENKEGEGDFSR
jgi:hypothetical protein